MRDKLSFTRWYSSNNSIPDLCAVDRDWTTGSCRCVYCGAAGRSEGDALPLAAEAASHFDPQSKETRRVGALIKYRK